MSSENIKGVGLLFLTDKSNFFHFIMEQALLNIVNLRNFHFIPFSNKFS